MSQGVKIPILDILVSASENSVVIRMKATIVLTIHSTLFSQVLSPELDLAVGSFQSKRQVGKSCDFSIGVDSNLVLAMDVERGRISSDAI